MPNNANIRTYDVILADPPWHFQNWSGDAPGQVIDRGHGAQRHYPTMHTSDICKLQVPAADNAVLFMWACWPMLPDALQVISAWGFEYKTLAWVWVKANPNGMGFYMGMGYYTRSNSEPCLMATRGKIDKPKDRGIMSLIYAPVGAHSRKPDDQYRKIESLYPRKSYLEMFARRPRVEWDVWGNEVESDITL